MHFLGVCHGCSKKRPSLAAATQLARHLISHSHTSSPSLPETVTLNLEVCGYVAQLKIYDTQRVKSRVSDGRCFVVDTSDCTL